MKGDFSRITNLMTFDKHYSLVLMQQGRVHLDSDWNAQALVQWFAIQNLAQDLIGPHGGRKDSFKIEPVQGDNNDLRIIRGRYYIEGMVCENDYGPVSYLHQRYYSSPPSLETGTKYLVYMHSWYRHITSVEDGYIREVALGGPDTTTRLQNMWQVKVKPVTDDELQSIYNEYPDRPPSLKELYGGFLKLIGVDRNPEKARLKAKAKKSNNEDDLCIVSPESRYRGAENQLYRVEIHQSGAACTAATGDNCATFKWSRENGSVVFPIREIRGDTIIVEHLGRDTRFGLIEGDWVEVVNDDYELTDDTNEYPVANLLQVIEIKRDTLQVKLSGETQLSDDESKHPLLRRWDHNGDGEGAIGGALKVVEDKWIELEDGIEIKFSNSGANQADSSLYKSRDWWWITARTATGDIEWPLDDNDDPLPLEALDHGHRYAPLAIIQFYADGTVPLNEDLRRKFKRFWV